MKKKVNRKSRPIVIGHLEKVSSGIFDKYQSQITEMIKGHYGVYALYRRNKLYYIGLATDLKRRIRQHLRNRHKKNWTHFNLYIFKKEEHIKELESLLLRIACPGGNTIRGRLKGSKDLLPHLKYQVKQQQQKELEDLFSHFIIPQAKPKRKSKTESLPLKGLLKNGQGIYASYKGKRYNAVVYSGGNIRLKDKMYDTPTGAAKAIVDRRTVNGWGFWKYKDKSGNLVPLKKLRK